MQEEDDDDRELSDIGLPRADLARAFDPSRHHASLRIAAYGFLVSETETIPPLRTSPRLQHRPPAILNLIFLSMGGLCR